MPIVNESKPESKPDLSAALEAVALRGMAGVALNSINVGAVLEGADDITPADAMLVELIAQNVALQAALERMTAERDQARVEAQFNNITVTDQAEAIRKLNEDVTRQRWTIARRDIELGELRAQIGILREQLKHDAALLAEGKVRS
jgi:hypothetical protein